MRTRRASLALAYCTLALLGAGCDGGAQGGHFAVSSMNSVGTTSPTAVFVVFRGGPPHDSTARGNSLPLLVVLVITPRGGGSIARENYAAQDGAFDSSYEWSWETAGGKRTAGLRWDRQKDVVSAGGSAFDRTKGNAFVLGTGTGGGATLTQVETTITASEDAGAFRQFQAALPASSPLSGVTLAP